MYGGHFGFALAGRAAARTLPLAVLIPAAFAPDLLRIFLELAGVSPQADGTAGSVTTTVLLGLLIGFAWRCWAGAGPDAVTLGMVVVSHAVGDLLEQRVPLWPGGPETGIALMELPVANHVVQLGVMVGGWLLYRHALPGRSGPGTPGSAWAMLLLILAAHSASILLRMTAGG